MLPKPSIINFEHKPMDCRASINRFTCHIANWLLPKKKTCYLGCNTVVKKSVILFVILKIIYYGRFTCDSAWQELNRRYGQSYFIQQTCEERVLSIPKIDRKVTKHLNSLSVFMKRSCYSLADKDAVSNLHSVRFFTAIVNKFPVELKRKWME